jgi:hypothetical protein
MAGISFSGISRRELKITADHPCQPAFSGF